MTYLDIKWFVVLVGRMGIKMLNIGDFFESLRCYSCGNAIKNVAYQESGDEDHIYCTKCWTVKAKEVAHRRECEKIQAECIKMLNAEAKAECFKALKMRRCSSEYYKGCEERKST
jgi:hypothetical protein